MPDLGPSDYTPRPEAATVGRMAPSAGAYGRLNTAVARVLTEAQEAAGLSQVQLAERSGIERITMRRYLADERAIDMDRLYRLANALGLTPHEVMARAQTILAAEDVTDGQ